MNYENIFVKEVKEKNITAPSNILNWYRNLYHTEDNHTERGIVAYAINDIFIEIEKLQAQNDDFDILVKDLRFRNKELQKSNEGLAKNIDDLQMQIDEVIEFRRNQIENIFTKLEMKIAHENNVFEQCASHLVSNDYANGRNEAIGTILAFIVELKEKYT